jgi:hypothetical protein
LMTLLETRISLDDWLTVLHRSINLVDLQLDVENSYLFTNNTFIKILCMFRALPCSSLGGLRCNCFLTGAEDTSPAEIDDTRGCIYTITT